MHDTADFLGVLMDVRRGIRNHVYSPKPAWMLLRLLAARK
jgi:hypothetical protein